jgi:hypothetical protein
MVALPELPDDIETADIFLTEKDEGDVRLKGLLELVSEIWGMERPAPATETVEKDAMEAVCIPMGLTADADFCWGAVHIWSRQRLWRRDPPSNLDSCDVTSTLGLQVC